MPEDRLVRWLSGPPTSQADLDEIDATSVSDLSLLPRQASVACSYLHPGSLPTPFASHHPFQPPPVQTLCRAVDRARVAECIAMLEDGADTNQYDEVC